MGNIFREIHYTWRFRAGKIMELNEKFPAFDDSGGEDLLQGCKVVPPSSLAKLVNRTPISRLAFWEI